MSVPSETTDPPRDHQCQNGCGRLAEVIIVRLSDSDVTIICDTCNLAMWMAVAEQLVEEAGALDGAESAPTP